MIYSNPYIIDPIRKLKYGYVSDIEFSWLRRLKLFFFPSAVRKILESISENQVSMDKNLVRAIYDELMNNTWFFQRWFFSCLRHFFRFDFFGAGYKKLNTKVLSTPYYFDLIATKGVICPGLLAESLTQLIETDILTPANEADLLNCNSSQIYGLSNLAKANLLTQENFDIVKVSYLPNEITEEIRVMSEAGLYTPANRATWLAFQRIDNAHHSLIGLGNRNLLTQTNFDAIMNYPDALILGEIIGEICFFEKLSQATFDRVLACFNTRNLLNALEACTRLSQVNLDFLFQHSDILLTNGGILWSRIPRRTLTNEFFTAIRPICEDNNLTLAVRQRNVNNYINHTVLGIAENQLGLNNNEHQPLNGRQSTHTASVHKSVSESASKLFARYSLKNIEDVLKQLSNTIKNLPDDNHQCRAAKRCILRITARDYAFVDSASQVSTRQLLALTWLAISDEAVRQGTLQDAQAQYIEGLYEIQRGYNLSDKNVDNKQVDAPICLAGAFNKLVEKLASIHPDCTILNITKQLAALKLPKVVKEEAIKYLNECAKVQTAEGKLAFISLKDKITNEGGAVIWDAIKKAVSERMFAEFGSLYNNNKADEGFVAFVECGAQSKELVEDMPAFLQKLQDDAKEPVLGRVGFFALAETPQNQSDAVGLIAVP